MEILAVAVLFGVGLCVGYALRRLVAKGVPVAAMVVVGGGLVLAGLMVAPLETAIAAFAVVVALAYGLGDGLVVGNELARRKEDAAAKPRSWWHLSSQTRVPHDHDPESPEK